MAGLSDSHATMLAASGLTEAVITERDYWTATTKAELRALGFPSSQQLVPCLVVPLRTVDGEPGGYQIRPEVPRMRDGKPAKYETLVKQAPMVDVPPSCLAKLNDPDAPLWITEGSKKADCAASSGLCCVSLQGVWNWRGGVGANGGTVELADWDRIALNGRKVYLAFDSDAAEKPEVGKALCRLAGILTRRKADVRIVRIPSPDGRKVGLDDFLSAGGTVAGLLAVASTELPSISGEGTDAPAAVGPPTESLAETLTRVEAFVRRFVVLPSDSEYVAVALWVAHSYFLEGLECSPYLGITSAEPRSGKTRLLDTLELMVWSPWRAVQPSDAVLFRKIDRDHPTLLLDEVDTVFGPRTSSQNEGLRSLLNAGNRRGTTVSRVEPQGKGQAMKLTDFAIFGPKALAGIGKFPPTVADRCIPIRLRRRSKAEPVERFRFRFVRAEGEAIAAELQRHGAALEVPVDVAIPDALDDRAAEGWEPLFGIAALAGGAWPGRCRRAALVISGGRDDDPESFGLRLLADCQALFASDDRDPWPSRELVDALREVEESPWSEFGRSGLNPNGLANLLKPHGIRPANVRVPGSVRKGYRPADFSDAFTRYLGANTQQDAATYRGETATPLHPGVLNQPGNGECSGVADEALSVAGREYDDGDDEDSALPLIPAGAPVGDLFDGDDAEGVI